ncbi:hypothetical protein GGE16_000961 [Rhizobium leguminosarum]|uniref:Lipoprotein n=1 Tax=Rhizobium leguminosarum TaxID=384 RepID=A0AAE2MGZ0_RHILE|nr:MULTISPECIES: hypothetical protein [Rhizobium]MBB4288945.1 hypothetical protein [Rhizobium leguminosarum]MBB4294962.1 hypothetical protein [Rhizobium leguminosarum]MBB4306355.1 hypothetical protein [Rhizobium leguminosarum]MBB4418064.1 hypothetical protein [Rhizobium leguminosarum]MBB4432909.1 hypothetical protein [Rhizobium esperanzae]
MKFRFVGAVALSFAVAGCSSVAPDGRPLIQHFFRDIVMRGCGFQMTWESARQATDTFKPVIPTDRERMTDRGLMRAAIAICGKAKPGNKSKAIEVQVPDSGGVLRKIVVERE